MKTARILFILIMLSTVAYAQSDSITTKKNYRNNVKLTPLMAIGSFGLEYEYGLSRRISLAANAKYDSYFFSNIHHESVQLSPQIRYYFYKNGSKEYNTGVYAIFSPVVYFNSYDKGSLNIQTTRWTYIPMEESGVSLCAGIGYQAILGKRFIFNSDILAGPSFYKQRFLDYPNLGWVHGSNEVVVYFHLGFGYRF